MNYKRKSMARTNTNGFKLIARNLLSFSTHLLHVSFEYCILSSLEASGGNSRYKNVLYLFFEIISLTNQQLSNLACKFTIDENIIFKPFGIHIFSIILIKPLLLWYKRPIFKCQHKNIKVLLKPIV